MIWAKRARRRAENANVWIQNVYQAAPSLVAICGLEDVTRIANYVWSEND